MTIITDYTLDASAKTITLGAAYSDLKIEEILSIFDLTIGAGIYDNKEPRKRRALKNENGMDISITTDETGCVITYIEDAIKSNNDKLIITTNQKPTPGAVEYFFNTETIDPSSEVISDPIFVGDCNLAWIWIEQTDSTDLTINLYSESSDTSTDRGLIKPYTLGMSLLSCTDFVESLPPYLRVGARNNDSVNTTNLTVKMRKTR